MSSDPANVDGAVANAALAYFTSRHRSGLLADAGPVFWVLLVGTLMILAIAAGTVAMTNNFRERALKSSQRELDNTGLLLALHFDRQIDVRIPTIATTHSDGSRPVVPIDRVWCSAGADGTVG